MKLLSSFLLLSALASLAFYSCNYSQGRQMKYVTHKEAADTQRVVAIDSVYQTDSVKEIPVQYGYIPTDSAKNFVKTVHLEKLIPSKWEEDEEGFPQIYNGFFGEDHYRIEFYISKVQADTTNPFVFLIAGRNRYKKAVTPFTGRIRIDSVFSYRDFNYNYSEYLEYREDSNEVYEGDTFIATSHMKGTFELVENSEQSGSGVYTGKIYIDVVKNGDRGYYFWFNTPNETRRGGLLMDGTWTSNSTNEQKPVIAARDLFMFANDILENFSYGEREIEINEKYRALGWDNYWENDEWWSKEEEESKQVMMMIWNF